MTQREEGLDSILGTWPRPLLIKRLREWADSLDAVEANHNMEADSLSKWANVLRDEADKLERKAP